MWCISEGHWISSENNEVLYCSGSIISLCTHSINRKVNTFQSEIKLLVLIQDHVNKCYIRAETFNTDTIETKACTNTTSQRQPDTFSKTFLLWRTNESICPHKNCGFTDPENSCVCVRGGVCVWVCVGGGACVWVCVGGVHVCGGSACVCVHVWCFQTLRLLVCTPPS